MCFWSGPRPKKPGDAAPKLATPDAFAERRAPTVFARLPWPEEDRSSYLVELLLVASVQEQQRERRPSKAIEHARA